MLHPELIERKVVVEWGRSLIVVYLETLIPGKLARRTDKGFFPRKETADAASYVKELAAIFSCESQRIPA